MNFQDAVKVVKKRFLEWFALLFWRSLGSDPNDYPLSTGSFTIDIFPDMGYKF